MTCEDCERFRSNPHYRVFCPKCLHCGARYIQLLGKMNLPAKRLTEWRRKVLADWMKHGHAEADLRRLAASKQASITPEKHTESEPLARRKSR